MFKLNFTSANIFEELRHCLLFVIIIFLSGNVISFTSANIFEEVNINVFLYTTDLTRYFNTKISLFITPFTLLTNLWFFYQLDTTLSDLYNACNIYQFIYYSLIGISITAFFFGILGLFILKILTLKNYELVRNKNILHHFSFLFIWSFLSLIPNYIFSISGLQNVIFTISLYLISSFIFFLMCRLSILEHRLQTRVYFIKY